MIVQRVGGFWLSEDRKARVARESDLSGQVTHLTHCDSMMAGCQWGRSGNPGWTAPSVHRPSTGNQNARSSLMPLESALLPANLLPKSGPDVNGPRVGQGDGQSERRRRRRAGGERTAAQHEHGHCDHQGRREESHAHVVRADVEQIRQVTHDPHPKRPGSVLCGPESRSQQASRSRRPQAEAVGLLARRTPRPGRRARPAWSTRRIGNRSGSRSPPARTARSCSGRC